MRLKQRFICVCCSALGLYFTEFMFTFLPFHPLLKEIGDYILLISIILGIVFSIFGIFYKKTSLLEMLLRFIALILSCFLFFIGFAGITRFLLDVLDMNMSSMQDNVSGLATALYFLIIISFDILAMVSEIIRSGLWRKKC